MCPVHYVCFCLDFFFFSFVNMRLSLSRCIDFPIHLLACAWPSPSEEKNRINFMSTAIICNISLCSTHISTNRFNIYSHINIKRVIDVEFIFKRKLSIRKLWQTVNIKHKLCICCEHFCTAILFFLTC